MSASLVQTAMSAPDDPALDSPLNATEHAPAPEGAPLPQINNPSEPTQSAENVSTTVAPTAKPTAKPKKKRKWLRRIGLGLRIGVPVSILALWIAIHRIEWLGPWLADTGRSIVGNDAIAKLEDWAYGVQDKYNQVTRGNEPPTAHWQVPAEKPKVLEDTSIKVAYPRFELTNVGPMHSTFAAPGDGEWVPMTDERNPDEPPPMWKTLVHPDKKRGWALVAVVAMDLRQMRLHLVPGTQEPISKLAGARDYKRTGLIPAADIPIALAAFNGGFKATHGQYGMKVDGVVFIEPRGISCTVAAYPQDKLDIRSWEVVKDTVDSMSWFRQTPACMVEGGELHKGLVVEENTLWGATLDRNTVIRRSAIGLSEDGGTLFVGISEATTALAIASAMQHVGAYNVAQLDVNWSFPKFVTIDPTNGDASNPTVKAIIDGFEYKPDDYVRRAALRDFFYVTRKPIAELPGALPGAPASSAAPSSSAPAPAPSASGTP
ncbi:MAG: hypothetical protein U0271_30460 [Polyangiaceae bacterium]